MKQSYLDSMLDDNEKKAVAQFVSSEVMTNAVKKVLLAAIYYNGTFREESVLNPLYNAAFTLVAYKKEQKLTNEQIGEDLSALYEGVNALEAGFSALGQFKPEEEKAEEPNQAR